MLGTVSWRPRIQVTGLAIGSVVWLMTIVSPVGLGAAPITSGSPSPSPAAARADDRSVVVTPVPGQVVRLFEPPATPYGPGHRGVDLAASPGQVVRAAMAGQVRFSGVVARVGWVTVDHGGGLRTTYGPLVDRIPQGRGVAAGQPIGRLDQEGTHLDWGARLDGDYIDPLTLLSPWKLRLTALPQSQ